MDENEREQTREEFDAAANMTPKELQNWRATDESKSVGQADGGGESKGHHSGRRIVEIQRTKVGDLSDDDYSHMRTVIVTCTVTVPNGLTVTSPTPGGATRS